MLINNNKKKGSYQLYQEWVKKNFNQSKENSDALKCYDHYYHTTPTSELPTN